MMVATFLVFTMHLGFAMLETGLTRAKNTVNILFKNTGIIAIGILTYALFGFGLMYPGDFNGYAGYAAAALPLGTMFGDAALGIDYYGAAYSIWTDFLFQAMFAATAATIVSGAVAGRIKLGSFFLFSLIFVGIVYPILGSWKWGGGWLDAKGFYDFAGSTLVHSVGGWAALAGAITLGPRIGKYVDGVSKAIPGHNMPLVTIGVFLLWLGWFGFNGGSALCGDADYVSFVMVTTALAAAAGIVGSGICSVIVQKKPDLTMVLNGALAGLVGITAGADVLTPINAIFIGLVTGAVVVLSVIALDKAKIDDPVGAISVHLVCGIIGTLAVALNSDYSFGVQLIGVLSYGAVAFIAALIIFSILKATIGIRVSEEEEVKGLDISEHSMEAYSGLSS
jgi:Amt family ammonium transporter